MMLKRRNLRVLLGAVAATMVAWACDTPGRLATSPPELPNFHEVLGPACFRMTGGGRIDTREDPTVPVPPTKNTPESHDFATFGFQARPNQCGEFPGTANMAWVEHNPDAYPVGAFTFHFHGDISFFAVQNHYATDPDQICGGFSGYTGRARTRDGETFENLVVTVDHDCDEGEPGVNHDHVGICITGFTGGSSYCRAGILTGGNRQKHAL